MKNRQEYIDIAKGIAIFLVVWGHSLKFALPVGGDLYSLIYTFHMPLFFCISGYFAESSWQKLSAPKYLFKKLHSLLFPFIIWGSLYTCFQNRTITTLFTDPYNLGYWFLLTLFILFVVFALVKSILHFIKLANNPIIEMVIFTTIFGVLFLIEIDRIALPETWKQFFSIHFLCKYFPFFIAAHFIHKYKVSLHQYITSNITYTICILLFIIGFIIEQYLWDSPLTILLCGFTGTYCCIYLSKKYEQSISFSKYIKYLGQNSINIYVLHYFFLNSDFSIIYNTLTTNGGNWSLILISFIISIIVTVLCILTSSIISSSKVLNYIAFGKNIRLSN